MVITLIQISLLTPRDHPKSKSLSVANYPNSCIHYLTTTTAPLLQGVALSGIVFASLVFAGTAMAYEKDDLLVRACFTNVSPNDDAPNIFAGGADLGVSLTVGSDIQLAVTLNWV